MTTTKITSKVYVVTGKRDTVVVTPFGRFTCASHEEGISEARASVARYGA